MKQQQQQQQRQHPYRNIIIAVSVGRIFARPVGAAAAFFGAIALVFGADATLAPSRPTVAVAAITRYALHLQNRSRHTTRQNDET